MLHKLAAALLKLQHCHLLKLFLQHRASEHFGTSLCRGFVQGDVTSWRTAFLLGMLAGSLAAARSVPADSVFDVLPETFKVRVSQLAVNECQVG
jgi:hypothetical protein